MFAVREGGRMCVHVICLFHCGGVNECVCIRLKTLILLTLFALDGFPENRARAYSDGMIKHCEVSQLSLQMVHRQS